MSAIIQETGGPLRVERAVDGKLKSRLEWPNGHLPSRAQGYQYIVKVNFTVHACFLGINLRSHLHDSE